MSEEVGKKMNQYSLEFKNQLVKEAIKTHNASMVARNHSIPLQTMYAWIRKSKAPKGTDVNAKV